jgi:hypothetical protein
MSATTKHYPDEDLYAETAPGSGWMLFSVVMLALIATLNVIEGIAAISNSTFFVEDARFVVSGLNTWGWVLLAIGVTQGLAALGIWGRLQFARWLGVALVTLNAIVQVLFLPAYPLWAMTMFALDLLVIYGLVAHGSRSGA